MKRLCPKFFFLFGWLLFLPQLVSAFTISVYKDGYNVKTDFSDVEGSSTHEMVATVKITNYTGASDYKFWISDSENFNNAQSKNFNLDDYLDPTCSRGTIELTVYIDSNSSAPNWYPHGVECKQIDDNISNLVVSVYKDGFNAKSTFTKVDDTSDEMVATVYIEDYTNAGDYEFWVGFGGWSNGVSENVNLGDYLSSECEAENIEVTFKVNRNSTAANLNPHDVTCKENHGIYIYSSTFYVDSKIDEFVLQSFIEDNSIKVSNYKWEYQIEGESTWNPVANPVANPTASQITVNRSQFPAKTSRFRLTVTTDTDETFESDNTWLMGFAPVCTGETKTVTVFEQDFGTGHSYRYRVPESEVSADIPDTYTYRGGIDEKINDGQMAIVADPYWCGCGNGGDMNQSVVDCTTSRESSGEGEGSSNWYRAYVYPTAGFPEADRIKFRDHTINEQSDDVSEYGLALLINYAENDETLAYEHVLTDEEMVKMVPGSTVRFSAHIASIAKYWSEQESVDKGVTMTISIDYNPVSNDPDDANWQTWVSAPQKVKHHDNWYPIVTDEMELPDRAGYYRIRIYSDGNSGRGYDILIDDIRLEACQPVIRNYLEYVDGSGQTQQSDDVTMQKHDDEFTLVVPGFDTGLLGKDPQVMLFVYDEDEYTYVGDLEYDSDAERYTINVSKSYMDGSSEEHHFETVPDQVQFVTVATTKEAAKDIANGIEIGAIDPVNSTTCYRSENIITLRTDCKAAPVISIAEGSSAYICAENPMAYPDVKIEFDNFTDEVQYKITSTQSGDNGATVSSEWIDVTADELTKGELTAALNGMAEWSWQAGQTYSVSVAVKEFFFGSNGRVEICERTAESGVTFYVRPLPGLTAELQDTEMCLGQEDKQITAAVNSSTNTYKWQVSKDNGQTWKDAEGTNTDLTYAIPSTAENGWQYRMQLSYVSQAYTCGPVETAPLTLTVSDCEDYQLSQTINLEGQDGVCPGEEFTITLAIKNLSQVTGQQDVEIAVILPEGLVRVDAVEGHQGAEYWDADNRKLWCHFGDLPPATTYNITWILRYDEVEGRTENVTEAVKAWISKSNDIEYATYDDQTNAGWHDYDNLLLKAKSPEPVSNLTAGGYVACATEGTLDLATLVSANGTQTWYSDQTLTQVVADTQLDANQAIRTTYYVTNTVEGQCESDAVPVPVWIKEISATPVVNTELVNEEGTYEICAAESGTLSLSTLVEAPYETLTWYTDAALTQEFVPAEIDMTVAQDVTYYVTNTETGKCPSAAVAVRILIKANTEAPTVIVDAEGYAYDECAVVGSKPLSELVSSDKSGLKWYDESGNEIVNPVFDTAAAGEYVYYVTNTNPGECESEKAEVRIRISANSSRPVVTDYDECAKSGTYSLSDLVMSDKTNLEWFDSNMQPLADATFDKSVPGNTTYYVRNTVSGECSSDMSEVHVNIKDQAVASDITADDMEVCTGASATLTAATSISDNDLVFTWYSDAELGNSIGTGATLQITGPDAQATYYVTVKGDNTCENLPGDAAEADVYAIAPIDNIRLEPVEERIGMGKETEKGLTVEPTDAYYTAVWTVNGQVIADPDSYFPAKPYSDVEYKVVVTDECGNEMEASAITKVVWPTIITPQNADGKNDDFLVGMQEDIHLEIFDRWGNVVFSGNDGWSQAEAARQQPGVYYYIATLPDGTAKQGTIEVYK